MRPMWKASVDGAAHTAFVQIADIECPLAALDERRVGAVDVRLFHWEIGVLSHFWGLRTLPSQDFVHDLAPSCTPRARYAWFRVGTARACIISQ
ncbi:MAG: hypothetical protein EBV66_03525 [Actinobacteria bacterium]|nr:hypothetical protein [Actinomycetota bacterium]